MHELGFVSLKWSRGQVLITIYFTPAVIKPSHAYTCVPLMLGHADSVEQAYQIKVTNYNTV